MLALPSSNQTPGESDTQGRGAQRCGRLGSHLKHRPAASLASGLLLTPGRTSEAKEPAKALLCVLDSAPALERPWVTRTGATQHLPDGLLLHNGDHTLTNGTRQHHSPHPIFGEHLLCASRRFLRRHPCSGRRSTSPPQNWAPQIEKEHGLYFFGGEEEEVQVQNASSQSGWRPL